MLHVATPSSRPGCVAARVCLLEGPQSLICMTGGRKVRGAVHERPGLADAVRVLYVEAVPATNISPMQRITALPTRSDPQPKSKPPEIEVRTEAAHTAETASTYPVTASTVTPTSMPRVSEPDTTTGSASGGAVVATQQRFSSGPPSTDSPRAMLRSSTPRDVPRQNSGSVANLRVQFESGHLARAAADAAARTASSEEEITPRSTPLSCGSQGDSGSRTLVLKPKESPPRQHGSRVKLLNLRQRNAEDAACGPPHAARTLFPSPNCAEQSQQQSQSRVVVPVQVPSALLRARAFRGSGRLPSAYYELAETHLAQQKWLSTSEVAAADSGLPTPSLPNAFSPAATPKGAQAISRASSFERRFERVQHEATASEGETSSSHESVSRSSRAWPVIGASSASSGEVVHLGETTPHQPLSPQSPPKQDLPSPSKERSARAWHRALWLTKVGSRLRRQQLSPRSILRTPSAVGVTASRDRATSEEMAC